MENHIWKAGNNPHEKVQNIFLEEEKERQAKSSFYKTFSHSHFNKKI